MASVTALRQQILGILAERQIPVEDGPDDSFIVPAPGENASTVVQISAKGGDDSAWISMVAPILNELSSDAETRSKATFAVNQMNAEATFGRFVYYSEADVILLEHELHGDDLQASELVGSLVLVARRADDADDRVQEFLESGKKFLEEDQGDVEA